MTNKDYTLSMWENNYIQIPAVQGEALSRTVNFHLKEEVNAPNALGNMEVRQKPIDLAGCSVRLYLQKPDQKKVFCDGTVTDAENGVATFMLPYQAATVGGSTTGEVLITKDDGTTLKGIGIELVVAASGMEDLESTDDFSALVTALNEVKTSANTASQAAADAQQAVEDATDAIGNINTKEQEITTAESARQAAESDRQTAEQSRSTAEGDRQTAEQSRAAAESSRVTEFADMQSDSQAATAAANTAADRANEAAQNAEDAIAGQLDPAIDARIAVQKNQPNGIAGLNASGQYAPLENHKADGSAHITTALHTRTGTANNLSIPDGAKNLTFLATATIADGDTWTVNGNPVTAVLQNGEVLPGELFKSGCWVTGVRLSDDGAQLFFRAGASTVPSIFGNGSDGDAVINGTVEIPVPVPHQSIIEKHYKSLYINAGAILRAAAHNAGLIIRVKGDCTIHGTIDQSGLAPKTNPQNNYPYPAQLVSGNGGAGGRGGASGGFGGSAMLKRAYGGGYGSGGGGGAGLNGNNGGFGGDSTGIDVTVNSIFSGGLTSVGATGNGTYGGGGGGGWAYINDGEQTKGGVGGNGPGGGGGIGQQSNGNQETSWTGCGGGAGNYGGGIIMLYVGGNLIVDGSIKCNGNAGGAGGNATRGGGGGGGGGGAVYIYHKGTYTNIGVISVNGGAGGTAGGSGVNGSAGGVGSITVIQHTN